MLYVFHVDTGTMMTFDMSLALESVVKLKEYIEKTCKISTEKQVLLINGGLCLDPEKTVCSYSAGTDTNPIFLFSKSVIEATQPPVVSMDQSCDFDSRGKIVEHCELPATYQTVVKRTQLAQEFLELARNQNRLCDKLVHDQHLQQQGWSAVVANLEDITTEFRKRSDIFEKSFLDYISERDSHLSFLKDFHADLATLSKIPLLAALLESSKNNLPELESSKQSEENSATEDSKPGKDLTLLEWISSTDDKNSMNLLHEQCSRGLEQFDQKMFTSLKDDVEDILDKANNHEMKEVKGLSDRLSGLETLMREAKRYLQEQSDLSQSFVKHQSRANSHPSAVADLCMSHRQQLIVMDQNHEKLCDIKRRCTRAKEELSVNLYHRLKWVMYIENKILEIDQNLVICHENLRRLRRHLEVLQQIHLAPATYLNAVAEVVRRRSFSQSFLLWASELACHLLTIHNEEVTRRKEFQAQFEGHFLNSLFPGMEDLPPPFATQAPTIFDSVLPNIVEEDVERLRKELPELAEHLNAPDMTAVMNFFLTKSVKNDLALDKGDDDATKAVEEKLVQVVSDVGLGSNLDRNLLNTTNEPTNIHGLPHLKDLDRGCESETDTEEFEKVGQSPLDLHFDKELPAPSRPSGTQDASTSTTEDNLQISRSEHEKLKTFLVRLGILAQQAITQLKNELNEFKVAALNDRTMLEEKFKSVGDEWVKYITLRDKKEEETIERIRNDYEKLLNELRAENTEKFELLGKIKADVELLNDEKSKLKGELERKVEVLRELQEMFTNIKDEHRQTLENLQQQLENKELEKQRELKESSDTLSKKHKDEIESIRSRFKLMTMERSPSDNSLEKIGDFSSLPNHQSLISQLTENFEMDKEKAVKEAILIEQEKWEKILADQINSIKSKLNEDNACANDELMRRITDDYSKQIDLLRERERNLSLESMKLKNTILQLTEGNENQVVELSEKLDRIQKEKEILEEKLEKLQNDRSLEMAASVAVIEGKVDATTSPVRHKDLLTKSDLHILKPGKVSIDSCKVGDQVVVFWDAQHQNFRIVQEQKYMFFLHSDSLNTLSLTVTDGIPNKLYCSGEVIDKEYCHVKKNENRYKLALGTKFFRVKVKPIATVPKDITQSLYYPKSAALIQSHMSQSTISSSCTEVAVDLKAAHSLPPTPTRVSVIPESVEEKANVMVQEQPEELIADSVEKNFDKDSGIVDVVEQATAAEEHSEDVAVVSTSRHESESSDRYLVCSTKIEELSNSDSSNWLEMLFSRLFQRI